MVQNEIKEEFKEDLKIEQEISGLFLAKILYSLPLTSHHQATKPQTELEKCENS